MTLKPISRIARFLEFVIFVPLMIICTWLGLYELYKFGTLFRYVVITLSVGYLYGIVSKAIEEKFP